MKLKLVTDGVVHGAHILDENNKMVGVIDEVVIKARQPLTLVKVGSDSYRPTAKDLDEMRRVFEEAETEKNFTVFTHSEVTVETIYPRGNVEITFGLKDK